MADDVESRLAELGITAEDAARMEDQCGDLTKTVAESIDGIMPLVVVAALGNCIGLVMGTINGQADDDGESANFLLQTAVTHALRSNDAIVNAAEGETLH